MWLSFQNIVFSSRFCPTKPLCFKVSPVQPTKPYARHAGLLPPWTDEHWQQEFAYSWELFPRSGLRGNTVSNKFMQENRHPEEWSPVFNFKHSTLAYLSLRTLTNSVALPGPYFSLSLWPVASIISDRGIVSASSFCSPITDHFWRGMGSSQTQTYRWRYDDCCYHNSRHKHRRASVFRAVIDVRYIPSSTIGVQPCPDRVPI